jgi:hypothetical protein
MADQLHLLGVRHAHREARLGQAVMEPGPLQGRFDGHGHRAPELPEDRLQWLEIRRQAAVILDDLPLTGQYAQGEVSFVKIEAGVVHRASVGW